MKTCHAQLNSATSIVSADSERTGLTHGARGAAQRVRRGRARARERGALGGLLLPGMRGLHPRLQAIRKAELALATSTRNQLLYLSTRSVCPHIRRSRTYPAQSYGRVVILTAI